MYKLLLILKYLRKRRIAWVSLIAVMLCTAMVLVVISVMGGWLEMFKAKFRGMSGDIVIHRQSLTGFAGYEQIIAEIKALKDEKGQPQVDAALPLITTFGLMNINNQIIQGVQITGLDLHEFSKFNDFRQSLWRQFQEPVEQGKKPPDEASFNLLPDVDYEAWRPNDPQALKRPGIIVGGPLVGIKKDKNGKTKVPAVLYESWARLEVVPMGSEFHSLKDATPAANIYWIVDASQTQLYQLDANSVYVPFDVLQKDLQMTPQTYTENVGGKDVQMMQPARCTEVQVKLKTGADRDEVIKKIRTAIVDPISMKLEPYARLAVTVEPWEQQQAKFLDAVEHEKTLVTFLFGLISIVAIFLVFCILYMIVVEKTRDIGILKSVGATSQGVAGIFLGYGLAIGIVGGGAGLIVGWIVVHWINEIHGFVAWLIGVPIWDPETYAFDKIPNTVDPRTAGIICGVAVLSAVLGAVVPAMRAARLNPVEALRFE